MKDMSKYEMMLDELMEQMPELKKEASALKDAISGEEEAPEADMEDMDFPMEKEEAAAPSEDGMEFPEDDEEELY